jgi:hypothetical protein
VGSEEKVSFLATLSAASSFGISFEFRSTSFNVLDNAASAAMAAVRSKAFREQCAGPVEMSRFSDSRLSVCQSALCRCQLVLGRVNDSSSDDSILLAFFAGEREDSSLCQRLASRD